MAILIFSKEQTKRCYDIFQFKYLNKNDPEEYKEYRLSIKRKLAKKYQDILSGIENLEDRKKELDRIYREEEAGFQRVIAYLK